MRLARPDIFHPRIVLAGCPDHVTGDGDDAELVAALRQRGLHARWLSWDDPEAGRADLVILRATRDYAGRLEEFLAWTTSVPNLLNAPAVVAWNVDWHYLGDLADRGVPTVPGQVYSPGKRVRLPRTSDVFVGPAVGFGTRRYTDRHAAAAYTAELHEGGWEVLVQPAGAGEETVLIFIGGRPSHAFTERHNLKAEPDFEIWDVGAAALAGTAAQVGIDAGDLLYARARLVGARLLELQLVDPSLGWQRLDAGTRDLAQRAFALSVESALERLGLGPFSQPFPH